MIAPLENLFNSSKLLVLNFDNIPANTPPDENIAVYFAECERNGLNPRTPQQRQTFNNRLLQKTGCRYLVSQYAEDRSAMLKGSSIAQEGRTLHLGVDIFCQELEPVHAPCDSELVRIGREHENHSFGSFAFLKPTDPALPYFFFGHLRPVERALGPIKAGEQFAVIGDYIDHENGGWSRHLHLQLFRDLPANNSDLIGYSTAENMSKNKDKYPNPMSFFPEWRLTQYTLER